MVGSMGDEAAAADGLTERALCELRSHWNHRPWLLRRTFDIDVKQCAKCGGRLVVRAVVTARESIAKILASLARTRAPPRAA